MSGRCGQRGFSGFIKEGRFWGYRDFMKFGTKSRWPEHVCRKAGAVRPSPRAGRAGPRRNWGFRFMFWIYGMNSKKWSWDRFIADTKAGRTPNPCVICNQKIKFGLSIDKARQMGADYVATGHYCQNKKTKTEFIIYWKVRTRIKTSLISYGGWIRNNWVG